VVPSRVVALLPELQGASPSHAEAWYPLLLGLLGQRLSAYSFSVPLLIVR